MEAYPGTNDSVHALTQSLGASSLNGAINVEKGGDYTIVDEERLPFECKRVLGNGWSAVVEKVEHRKTKEVFAKKVIKFPRGKTKSREQAEERYYNEVAIIRSLYPHCHVVELFATYTTPRSGVLLLRPAADHGDLQQYLDQYADAIDNTATAHGDISRMTKTLEKAFGCLSSGLAYMHEKGIRHKDIKPGNILIHQGNVIYTDFGASKDTTKDGQCTTEGRPESLTRRYSAPEVLEYDKRNFAADVFSLGCVFVEMMLRLSRLTEHEDLEDEGYSGIMEALHALLLAAEIPSNLECLLSIVILMTLRDPSKRPGSEGVATRICCDECLSCSQCYSIRIRLQPKLKQKSQSPEAQVLSPIISLSPALYSQATQSPLQPLLPQPTSQPEWNTKLQRYLHTVWNEQYQRNYWEHYVENQGWVFLDWVPMQQDTAQAQYYSSPQRNWCTDSAQTVAPFSNDSAGYGRLSIREGTMIHGSYSPHDKKTSSQYHSLDPSFYVRGGAFFEEGKVFSVLFSEPVGTGNLNGLNPMADYNTNLSMVKYNEYVHTQVRRFIVTKRKREFCFAVPIFTYYGQATTKNGVVPDEHAIAYSLEKEPQLVRGEAPLRKAPIPIVTEENNKPLVPASRIYFAIHHPIQYNVKVKNLGHVHPDYLATFLGYWNQENSDSKQDSDVASNPNNTGNF